MAEESVAPTADEGEVQPLTQEVLEPEIPFSAEEAELCLTGELLLNPKWFGEVSLMVATEDFANERVRIVFDAICSMAARGDPIDPTTVFEELKRTGRLDAAGGAMALSRLMDFAYGFSDVRKITNYAKIVRKEAQSRALGRLLREKLQELESGKDPNITATELESSLRRIVVVSAEEVQDDLTQISMNLAASLEPGADRGIAWPWPDMNMAVGLLVPGRIWAVSAYSGGGKSTLLRALALDLILSGTRVAYFSIEEQGEDVLGLMSCALEGVSYTRFGQGFALTEAEVDKIRDGMNTIYSTKCFRLNKQKVWRPTQLLSKVRQYAEDGISVVVIDHAHLISYPARNKDEREFWIGQFAVELAALCQQAGVVALVAYQPKKPATGGDIFRPVAPDEIRGNSEIWNIVYNTLSPYRPWVRINSFGNPEPGPDGRPVIGEPYKPGNAPVSNYFYVAPGKQRIGGFGGRPVILRFDPISGRVYA